MSTAFFYRLDQDEFFNYMLKCTDGIFSGKFLYINTTPDGELFGSGDPEQVRTAMLKEKDRPDHVY